jgi:transcriptional regulator with XRE-family HTH domain
MESLGQKLRQARLRVGLSLEAVSSRTFINIRSLSAIEEDQFDRISSRFLYKSFVRQIGRAVGLDGDMLEQDLLSAAGNIPEPLMPGEKGTTEAPNLAPLKHQRTRVSPWAQSLVLLAVMLIACSAFYAIWQKARSHVSPPAIAADRPAAATLQTGVLQPTPALPVNGAFHIQLSAIEQTWLSVVTDGKEVYNGILRRAETKTLEGHELTRIRTGNAGAVAVVFNGRNLGPLGSRGQVRTIVFSRNGYEVLQPEAGITQPSLVLATFRAVPIR